MKIILFCSVLGASLIVSRTISEHNHDTTTSNIYNTRICFCNYSQMKYGDAEEHPHISKTSMKTNEVQHLPIVETKCINCVSCTFDAINKTLVVHIYNKVTLNKSHICINGENSQISFCYYTKIKWFSSVDTRSTNGHHNFNPRAIESQNLDNLSFFAVCTSTFHRNHIGTGLRENKNYYSKQFGRGYGRFNPFRMVARDERHDNRGKDNPGKDKFEPGESIELSSMVNTKKKSHNSISVLGAVGISILVIFAVALVVIFCVFVRKSNSGQISGNQNIAVDANDCDPMEAMQKYRHQLGITESTETQEVETVSARCSTANNQQIRSDSIVHVSMNELLEHETQRMKVIAPTAPTLEPIDAAVSANGGRITTSDSNNVACSSRLNLPPKNSATYSKLSPKLNTKTTEGYYNIGSVQPRTKNIVKQMKRQESTDEYYEDCQQFKKPEVPIKTPESREFSPETVNV